MLFKGHRTETFFVQLEGIKEIHKDLRNSYIKPGDLIGSLVYITRY